MKNTFLLFSLLSVLFWFTALVDGYGQTPETDNIVYEEHFATPGFPIGWSTNDASGQGVVWTWCANPANGQVGGCPDVWSGGNNQQIPFAANSANNGFLTLDSDAYGPLVNPHRSQLTTPIYDFSNEDTVWVSFQTHLGVFNTSPFNNAIFRVSNNGGQQWENYNCFPEFPAFDNLIGNIDTRWSENPKTIHFNVSAIAANQSNVRFQWQWRGNHEYQWSIDDFEISDTDPRPANDLALEKGHFLIPENAITPISEIEAMTFGLDFLNQGSRPQEAVTVLVDIFETGENESVFSDTIIFENLAVDQQTDLLVFPNTFTPPPVEKIYSGQYRILTNQVDFSPENNIRYFDFEISENTLAKERLEAPDKNTAPVVNEWDEKEPRSWAWGNYFYIKNGTDKIPVSATFSIANAVILPGRTINLVLFEWNDLNNDELVNFDERTLVAFNDYELTGNEPNDELITLPLQTVPGFEALKDNQSYLLMLEYYALDNQEIFIAYSSEQDYTTNIDFNNNNNVKKYASVLGIGNPVNQETYTTLAFGLDKTPIIRLNMENIVSTQMVELPDNQVNIFPNPNNGVFDIQLDFPTVVQDLNIQISDITGKVIQTISQNNVREKTIDVELLHAGVYFVEIIADNAQRTTKVVVF